MYEDEARSRPVDPLVGEIVADRYLIRGMLDQGGMGLVYRAVQLGLERQVALKLLDPSVASDQRQVDRFHREAVSASRLDHPGVAVVHDHGEWEGHLFLVMELLRGATLRQLMVHEAPLEPVRVVSLLAQVADVLTAAHDAGVVHRDLKPENIMICPGRTGTERVKVVDFGLAAILGQDDWAHAPRGRLLSGTPRYMSPEQCRGARVETSSDIYSLGVVLYELLCGRPPHAGDSAAQVVLGHLYGEAPVPARDDGAPVHAGLAALALCALAKVPAGRPASAEVFRDRLLAAVDLQTDRAPEAPANSQVEAKQPAELLPTLAHLPALRVRVVAGSEAVARALCQVLEHAGIRADVEASPGDRGDLAVSDAVIVAEDPTPGKG